MLGPGNGVAGNQMHAIGNERPQIADDRLLGRAHVADDRTRREMVADSGADLGIGAQRRADHHQIGALDASAQLAVHAIEIAQRPGLVTALLAAGRAGRRQ